MTLNEIVGRLKAGGLDASSTNRSAAVYVTEARSGRAVPGWFGFRIICESEGTERRARSILSRWYEIEASGNVWRLRSKNRVPLMAIKRGGVPPTPPTPTDGPMYFEAAQANSTVSMMSTLATAPDLEYSRDGETWHEWQHTTHEGGMYMFDIITFTDIGDRVYIRGNNQNGFATDDTTHISHFAGIGLFNLGGNIMSLIDKTMTSAVVPLMGFYELFANIGDMAIFATAPDMSHITEIGDGGCAYMFQNQPLSAAADMPALTTIGEDGCLNMYNGCTFAMSDNGTTLNFAFPTPPITAGETTYTTAYDIAQWMGNTNGFVTP